MIRPLPLLAGAAAGAFWVRQQRSLRQAERFAAAALESLLKAIDANDPQTGQHVRRVASYALILVDEMGLDDAQRRTIELASLFHDIGKIHEALFDIVHDEHKLTPAEKRAIATHPARGAEVLAPIADFYPELAEAVLSHHERWDGSGYPRGLKGRAIPLAARVVAIVDTFDAITHRRRYHNAKSAQQAASVIAENRGTQFDPSLVDLMLFPPVFERIVKAHREARRPKTRRGKSLHARGATGDQSPNVRIRWRTKSDLPARVKQEVAAAKR